MGERVASARGMLKVLQDNQRQLEAGDCCPTCRRGFASLAEKQQILATVAEEIQVGKIAWGRCVAEGVQQGLCITGGEAADPGHSG